MDTQDLRIRRVAIDTWRENVAYLHRDCPVVRAAGFQALAKVLVRANGGTLSAVLNVVDDERIVGCGELGVSEDAFAQLEVPDGHPALGAITMNIIPEVILPLLGAVGSRLAGDGNLILSGILLVRREEALDAIGEFRVAPGKVREKPRARAEPIATHAAQS